MDPTYRRYVEQRRRAKIRKIEWLLPYWEWLQIWQDSGHLNERGAKAGQWVMGRNGDIGPYSRENVKIIHVETNNSLAQITKRQHRLRKLAAVGNADIKVSDSG